jgi:hypothetical protein
VESGKYIDDSRAAENDSAIFAVRAAQTRYETHIRISQSIGAHHGR